MQQQKNPRMSTKDYLFSISTGSAKIHSIILIFAVLVFLFYY